MVFCWNCHHQICRKKCSTIMPIVLIPTRQELKCNHNLVGIESPKLTYPGDCVCQTLWQSHHHSQQGNEHHVIEKQPAKDVSHPSPIMRTLYKWQLTPPPSLDFCAVETDDHQPHGAGWDQHFAQLNVLSENLKPVSFCCCVKSGPQLILMTKLILR